MTHLEQVRNMLIGLGLRRDDTGLEAPAYWMEREFQGEHGPEDEIEFYTPDAWTKLRFDQTGGLVAWEVL